jgi:hypothetical protein
MPIQIRPATKPEETEEPADDEKELALFRDDGAVTLAGEVIADFLEASDFDKLFDVESGQAYVVNPAVSESDPYAVHEKGDGEDDDGEGGEEGGEGDDGEDDDGEGGEEGGEGEPEGKEEPVTTDAGEPGDGEEEDREEPAAEAIIPGLIAAQLVDEDDLADMFGFYLGSIAARVQEAEDDEDAEPKLEDRAILAVFRDVLEDDGRTIREDKRSDVAGWLREMLKAGMVVTDEVNEKFLTKSQRVQRARKARKPKTGTQRAKLKKRRRERKKKKSKVHRQEKMLRRKRKTRNTMLAKQRESEESLVFGRGWGLDEADLIVGVRDDAELVLTREQYVDLEEQYGLTATCPEEGCGHEAAITSFLDEKKPAFLDKMKKGKKKNGDEKDADESEVSEMKMKCPKCGHEYEMEEGVDEKKRAFSPEFLKNKRKSDDDGGTADKGGDDKKTSESRSSAHGSPFAVAAGRPNLNEGHSLAASTLAAMGVGRKQIEEEAE